MVPKPGQQTKRLEHRYLTRLGEVVTEILRERNWTQGEFGKVLKLSQSSVSQMAKGGDGTRGIGINALIALRQWLAREGKPQTIDELLGLEPLPAPKVEEEPSELRLLRQAVEQISIRLEQRPPASTNSLDHPRPLPPAKRR